MAQRTGCLFANFESSIANVNSAQMLLPLCYTDPEIYEFARSATFDREWSCGGRETWACEWAEFVTAGYSGEPIVVVRNCGCTQNACSNAVLHGLETASFWAGPARLDARPGRQWVGANRSRGNTQPR
jgi:hypothetical protein